MSFDPRDPDAILVATFRHKPEKNERKSLEEGRPIYDDVEVVDIRAPGSRNFGTYPATAFSHWRNDPFSGEQVKVTYAERFSRQYQQFKAHAGQTKSGTPLDDVPFLTEARRAELRAQNVYTVEQLALIDGQELKNLGPFGRDQKNLAIEYIETGKRAAPNMQLQSELEALRARAAVLEDDNIALKQRAATSEAIFDEMTDDQLRNLIKSNTGHAPTGNFAHKQLVRMALETRPSRAA